jgi:PhoPQ-activated pathogenicity-related protein
MRRRVLLLLLAASGAAFSTDPKHATALDRYVQEPDSSFRWEVARTLPGNGATTYMVDLTSQSWRTPADVDRTEWRHWLIVVKPDRVSHATGFLFINGGSNGSRPPQGPDDWLRQLAVDTGSVVADLRMVPNQPLIFAGESKRRSEDALIAFTWDKFLRGGDDRWPARLPMTKSVVRAMNAVTALCAAPERGAVKVDRFVVTGASKRGWTAWSAAAADPRVVAVAPIVIDLLNLEKSFDHHYRAYGFFAPAVQDYLDMRIMDWAFTPKNRALMKIEDPYEYRDRLTLPKYMVNSAGDQFFLPDSSQFYWDSLRGEKHLRYVPNTDHSLRGSDAREGVAAFYELVVNNQPRPRCSWKFEKDGSIRVKPYGKPSEVMLWQATNSGARDFRLMTIGPAYKSSPMEPDKNGMYVARVPKPEKGWTAFFVEMTYPTGGRRVMKLTSGVRVLPDTLPYPSRPHQSVPPVLTSGGQ